MQTLEFDPRSRVHARESSQKQNVFIATTCSNVVWVLFLYTKHVSQHVFVALL